MGITLPGLMEILNASNLVSSSYDGSVKIWDSSTNSTIRTIQCTEAVRSVCYLDENKIVLLKFRAFEIPIEVKAKIAYRKDSNMSYGLQFVELTRDQKRDIKIMMARLGKDNYRLTRPMPRWTQDLGQWVKTLIKTGKGLLPEIPQTFEQTSKKQD